MAKREWELTNDDRYDTEEDFRVAVQHELALAEHAGHRLGFGVFYAPIRQKIGDEVVTLGARFESFTVPLVPGRPQQAGPLPETPQAEPEADEPEEMIVMVAPNGETREVPEAEVSDLMEQGWTAEDLTEPEPQDFPEPVIVGKDKYAE